MHSVPYPTVTNKRQRVATTARSVTVWNVHSVTQRRRCRLLCYHCYTFACSPPRHWCFCFCSSALTWPVNQPNNTLTPTYQRIQPCRIVPHRICQPITALSYITESAPNRGLAEVLQVMSHGAWSCFAASGKWGGLGSLHTNKLPLSLSLSPSLLNTRTHMPTLSHTRSHTLTQYAERSTQCAAPSAHHSTSLMCAYVCPFTLGVASHTDGTGATAGAAARAAAGAAAGAAAVQQQQQQPPRIDDDGAPA